MARMLCFGCIHTVCMRVGACASRGGAGLGARQDGGGCLARPGPCPLSQRPLDSARAQACVYERVRVCVSHMRRHVGADGGVRRRLARHCAAQGPSRSPQPPQPPHTTTPQPPHPSPPSPCVRGPNMSHVAGLLALFAAPQMIRLVTFALGGEGWLSFMGGPGSRSGMGCTLGGWPFGWLLVR